MKEIKHSKPRDKQDLGDDPKMDKNFIRRGSEEHKEQLKKAFEECPTFSRGADGEDWASNFEDWYNETIVKDWQKKDKW